MKQDPRDREGRATTTTDLTMGRHQERPVVNETRSPAAVRRPAAARQPAAAEGEQEEQAQKTRPADSPTTDFTMEDLKLAARYRRFKYVAIYDSYGHIIKGQESHKALFVQPFRPMNTYGP